MSEPDEDWIDRIEKGTFDNVSPQEPLTYPSQQYSDESNQLFDELKRADGYNQINDLLIPLFEISGIELRPIRNLLNPPEWGLYVVKNHEVIFSNRSMALVIAWFIRSGLDQQRLVYRYPDGTIRVLTPPKENDQGNPGQ